MDLRSQSPGPLDLAEKMEMECDPVIKDQVEEKEEMMETPLEQAIRIPLIFENIAKNLEVRELQICREVNLDWRDAATDTLILKDCLQTNITDPYLGPLQAFKCFNDCLSTSSRFPSTHFNLRRSSNSTDLIEFFSLMGPSIKTLSLSNTGHPINPSPVEKSEVDILYLPSLWTLTLPPTFPDENDMTHKILSSAVNLRILENVTSPWFRCLVKMSKIPLVKSVRWIRVGDNETTLQDLTDFAKAKPRLQKCGACALGARGVESETPIEGQSCIVEAFINILTSSCDTLEELELTPLPYGSSDLPQLKRVKKLKLRNCYNPSWAMFPFSCNLTFIFPHVESLNLHLFSEWKQLLPSWAQDIPTRKLTSVHTLECGDDLNQVGFMRLVKLCPNVKRMKIHASSRLDNFFPYVCAHMTSLEFLELVEVPPYHYIVWDAAMTGFSDDVCRKLAASSSTKKVPDEGMSGRKPWIGHMTQLKTLDIWLHEENPIRDNTPYRLTNVSGLYAFQDLPKLQVRILGLRGATFSKQMKDALGSVTPFVQKIK